MNPLDAFLVALAIAGAVALLWRFLRPRGSGGCGCGALDCKAPKPKLSGAPRDSR